MTHHVSSGVHQHSTHEELVGHSEPPVPQSPDRTLDAIIVPASRSADNLDHAVGLAVAAQCRLVVLCSREAHTHDVSQRLAAQSFTSSVVIDLPPDYRHPWLEFATSDLQEIGRLPEPCAARDTDLSTKRNIGLALARMLGWDRVFFLDDDIREVSFPDLRRTVSMLGQRYYSVGMQVSDFPDNSVVCHAHRETGQRQGVFVSGSVLAIDCTAPVGFFPNVYNEDWLFFYNDTVESRLASSGLPATQLPYDPFDDPRRAAGQEFGDVIAEGLYALLHGGRNTTYATREYWADFLAVRREFLDAIIARADSAGAEVRQKLLDSVTAARECSAQIEPSLCEHYVRLWRKDLGRWEQTLKEIPRLSSVTAALSRLGLASAAGGATSEGGNRGASAAANAQPGPEQAAPLGQPTASGSVLISDAGLNFLSPDDPPLALLTTLATTDQVNRLHQTGVPAANLAALRASQAKKLAAMGRMVGVLVVVGVLVAYQGVRLALTSGSAVQQNRPGRHRRIQKGARTWRGRPAPAIRTPK